MMNKKISYRISLLLILIVTMVPLILWGQSQTNIRPEGPMKYWSKSDFDRYMKTMEQNRALAKPGAHEDRKFGFHDGNAIRTLFYNYGSIGRPNTEPSIEWPSYSNHGYAYEFGPIVGAEVVDKDGVTKHIFSDGMLDGGDFDPAGGVNVWGWEPLPGYANPDQDFIGTSDAPETWGGLFPVDVDGNQIWPGQFGDGKIVADYESYFKMDDRFNKEFSYYPSPSDVSIGGLGIEVTARGYQYAASVAEDILFFQYEIKNVSEKRLEKVVVGMIGDPHIGGAGDFADDYAGFINQDGLDSYTGEQLDVQGMVYAFDKEGSGNDFNIPWSELGWLGFKFLESPENSTDGVDNDSDGWIDESQYNGIDDDGDWQATDEEAALDLPEAANYWDPIMWNGIDDDDDGRIDDWGDLDGKSDDLDGDGLPSIGEPDFELTDVDESDMIGLTSFWAPIYGDEEAQQDEGMWTRLTPGTFATASEIAQEADNIFIFGSGYFSLDPGDVQKFSVAMLLGQGKDDLLGNAKVADWIYRLGFNFTKPPDKPELVAVPGDGAVTLYWNDIAEQSVDPVNGQDFEGYKIYRSLVKGEWGKEITNNQGVVIGYVPIAQFDYDDEYSGPHPVPSAEGYHMDMGDNTGLARSFRDTNLVNGLTYYYAVTAYDKGSVTGNLTPLECSKSIDDVNVREVVPRAAAAGYNSPVLTVEHYQGYSTATFETVLIDPMTADENVYYDVVISKDSGTPRISASEVTISGDAEDTVAIWEDLSLSTLSNVWLNQLPYGIVESYVLDIAGVTLDSVKWLTSPEYFTMNVVPGNANLARDLEIRFFETVADTTIGGSPIYVNFQIWNVNDNEQLDVRYKDIDGDGGLSVGDIIYPITYLNGRAKAAWTITLDAPADTTLIGSGPFAGTVALYTSKPFDSEDLDDRYRISFVPAYADESTLDDPLADVKVVPNPYVASSSFEVAPPSVFTYGRGDRRIDFIHLPQVCTIRIYTMVGEHVETIEHSSSIFNGTESWNLLSKDDFDIAPGIYIYHIETPAGAEKIGRIAIIK